MPPNFIRPQRDQRFLLAVDMREWLPEDDLAYRVIDAVETLDLGAFRGAYRADGLGRAAFDPAMMVGPRLRTVLADSGYVSEENSARADAGHLRLLAPLAKDPGRHRVRDPDRPRHLDRLPATARARRRMQHPRGRADYRMRARTVEPVAGQLKTCQGLAMMSRRGFTACSSEWLLACAAHNLRSCTGTG